jgi:hypothetical protein
MPEFCEAEDNFLVREEKKEPEESLGFEGT